MTDLDQAVQAALDKLKTTSQDTVSFQDLERLVLEFTREVGHHALEHLTPRAQAGISPQARLCPTCQTPLSPSETRFVSITSLWGSVRVPKRRYRCQHCHASLTAFADASLDESGFTPLVLEPSEHLARLLPYQASSLILREWGVETSSSALARASFALEQLEQERSQTRLIELSTRPLVLGQPTSRVWMLEVDGVIVPTRAEGHLKLQDFCSLSDQLRNRSSKSTGLKYPRLECRRSRLYQPSIHPNTTPPVNARDPITPAKSSSSFNVEKKLSITALSV